MNAITSIGELTVHKSRQYIMEACRAVDPRIPRVDRVDRVLHLFHSGPSAKFGAYKLASFAAQIFRFDTRVAFCLPSRWQPRNLRSVVVRTNRCGVAGRQGRFEFDTEANFVGVHLLSSSLVGFVGRSRCVLHSRMTHMSHAFRGSSSEQSHVSARNVHVFSGPTWTACLAHRRVQTCIA